MRILLGLLLLGSCLSGCANKGPVGFWSHNRRLPNGEKQGPWRTYYDEANKQLVFGAHLVWDEGLGEGWGEDELFKLSDGAVVMYEGKISAYFPDVSTVSENEIGHYMLGVKHQSDAEIGGVYHE